MATTGSRLKSDSSNPASSSSQKYSVATAISSSSSKLASRKLEMQNESTKLDDEGKVLIRPMTGSNVLNNSWTVWFMNRGPGVKISNYLDATKKLESFSTVEEFWQIYTHLKRVDRLPFTSEFQVFRKGVKPMWEDPVNVNGGKWVIRFKRPFKTYSNNMYTSSTTNSANNSLATTPTSSHVHLATLGQSHAATGSSGDGSAGVASHLPSQGSHRSSNQARLQTRLFWEKLLLSIIGGSLAKESNVDANEITGAVMSVRKDEDILSVWTRSGEHGEGNPNIMTAIRKLLDLPENQVFGFKIHSESIKEGVQKQAFYNNNGNSMIQHNHNGSLTNSYHNNHHNSHHNNHYNNHHSHHNNHSFSNTHSSGSSVSNSSLWGNSSQFSDSTSIGSPSLSPSSGPNHIFGHSNGSNTSLNHHHSSGTHHHQNSGHHINSHHRPNSLQQLEATASVLRSASPAQSLFPASRFSAESGPVSAAAVGSSRLSSTSSASSATSPISSVHKTIGSGSIW